MSYKVVLPQGVAEELGKIPKKHKEQILVHLKALETSPLLGKKLFGPYKRFRSLRVGEYRIIYQLKIKELLILVIRIGNRQSIY